ncbi:MULTISPECIES: patatin-like phospholipase family protein [unclassified Undibacterium]|uniref:patatin-like phospholipase family protein n=1 Tax=unclassified Undibacterium TaxID=2630295 RepID=UPI002AC9A9FA|nr:MULTISPECIES: patatin-like phospholipase family protein [unclassified Undibacterium]MEB0140422.1 patatin-like phospholipase family protein [Undibacterium sp. CCC2.1]MEB0173931.1 patatin-like phospholipase family protein [Undibacterium sp. CCC1.1]MEB0177409.1 patatin-like phospholipase family protein [Undibacterium sp. CCC3.4]MEB0217108.1 patatin-like phospholipase family protein [Undibacterium sp. 5I2]WPX45119.1 patatin-like phospholipase family protein [Undibacterium sp. CCC3.4]
MSSALHIFAGRSAYAHLRTHGLQARDVALLPAAAGGPKGLILQALDQWLFGTWLPSAPRPRTLIGASIGAWRMAAASQADPVAAFTRLAELYCEQTYPERPSAQYVTTEISRLLQAFLAGHEAEILTQPLHRLQILCNRGAGALSAPLPGWPTKAGFARAALANLRGRPQLARHIERVVIGDTRADMAWMETPFDDFRTHFCALNQDNLAPALLASGTLPLLMAPVTTLPGAPPGQYWDGGMIDYHLALPYARLAQDEPAELVLYPHFGARIVPGWLDKNLPWRSAASGARRHWLDNVILLAPSASFIASLPRGKLPDRQDFFHYGTDHRSRIRAWQQAISASAALRDEFAAFVTQPDMGQVRALNF